MDKKILSTPTLIEKVSGSLWTEGAATIISALSGTPVAALLPVLTNTLANQRFEKRLEHTLNKIASTLAAHSEKLHTLSDAQYKLINETVLTSLSTVDETKLNYLHHVVQNSLDATDIIPQEAAILSRVIRDISAEEVAFVVRNIKYQAIQISNSEQSFLPETLSILANSEDEQIVSGLIALGILLVGHPSFIQANIFRFSRSAYKLASILQERT